MKLKVKGRYNIPNETLFDIIKTNSDTSLVTQKTYSELLLDLVAENRLDYEQLEEAVRTKLCKWFSDLVRQKLVQLLPNVEVSVDLRHDELTKPDKMYVATNLNKFDPSLAPNICFAIRRVLLMTFPGRIVNINHPDTYDKFVAKYVLSNKWSYNEAQKYAEKVIAESINAFVGCVIHNLINGTDLNKRPSIYVYQEIR
jgi:hypothetical protein